MNKFSNKKKIIFSLFLEKKERNEIVAVFHKLHPSPLYFSVNDWYKYKKNPKNKKIFAVLRRARLIIQSPKEDQKELKRIRREYQERLQQVNQLYLVLTHNCNLQCKYCFVPYSFSPGEREVMMTPEIAKKGINLWTQHIERNSLKELKYFIIFYGGEPLLNPLTLQESLNYIQTLQNARKLPKENLTKMLFTNGTLVNEKIAQMLREYNVEVTISIDTPERLHNIYRGDKKGKGTFKRVEKGLRILQEEGVNTSVSTVITPMHLDRISEVLKFLEKKKIKKFALNPVVGKTIPLLDQNININNYYKQAAKKIIEIFVKGEKKGIHEEQVGWRVEAFKKREFYPKECSIYGEQIVIQPDGHVSSCHVSPQYNIKHINDLEENFDIRKNSLGKQLIKRLPLYNRECLNCEAISICGGGCPWSVNEIKGSSWGRDERSCCLTKEIFNVLIWENFKRSKSD